MSGAMWFFVVVVVSVFVSGSVGVILNFFLGDSKENLSDGGVVRGVETSRDENKGVVRVGRLRVSKEWHNGYLAGHADGLGREDYEKAKGSMQRRLSGLGDVAEK
mgnify:CR=1 FL=1